MKHQELNLAPETDSPSAEDLREAARLIRAGRLVAFPTETVYGLGANALDPAAVDRIYEAKGRPHTSPLIVHVASIEMARILAAEWPDAAERLAQAFWPGPLTLVVRKAAVIPDCVTAGLPTVGLRLPGHPLALELLRAAGVPLAAPSANRFTEVSPTTAEHVRKALGNLVALVLDGGPCRVGIESAVISVAGPQPVLLRSGMITREQLEAVAGPVQSASEPAGVAHPSPGLHPRHYSPRTRLMLVEGGAVPAEGRGAYLQWKSAPAHPVAYLRTMPATAAEYAAALYGVLHDADNSGCDWIAVDPPPGDGEWEAIGDRLRRAAGVR